MPYSRGGLVYRSPLFQCAPGLTLPTRAFPYLYPGVERGLFIELPADPVGLHYLVRTNELPLA